MDNIQHHRAESFTPIYRDMDTLQSIDVNVVELCNRKCSFCPRGNGTYSNQNLHMSEETMHQIGRSLKQFDYKNNLTFAGFSEPYLHNDLLSLITIIDSYNINFNRFEIITNGDFLDETNLKKINATGITSILVSLYDSKDQVDDMIKLFESVNYNKYVLRHHYDPTNSFGLTLNNRAGSVNSQDSPDDPDAFNRPCYIPFYKLCIDWDGTYILCTQDWQKEAKISKLNIHDISVEDYWNSSDITEYRDVLKHNRSITPCNGCNIKGNIYGRASFMHMMRYKY